MKTDLFQSCGHCWVFQICWHIECSPFIAFLSKRLWWACVIEAEAAGRGGDGALTGGRAVLLMLQTHTHAATILSWELCTASAHGPQAEVWDTALPRQELRSEVQGQGLCHSTLWASETRLSTKEGKEGKKARCYFLTQILFLFPGELLMGFTGDRIQASVILIDWLST